MLKSLVKSVVVVEDDRGLREQLVEILRPATDIKCIGAYASAEEALNKIPTQIPDVVVMDIRLPGMSGIQCVDELKRIYPTLQIIMVTAMRTVNEFLKHLRQAPTVTS